MPEYWLSVFNLVDGKPGPLVGHFVLDTGAKHAFPAPPNPVVQFLAARTEPDAAGEIPAGELYAAFAGWAAMQRLENISVQMFGREMTAAGHPSVKRGKGGMKRYSGFRLLPPDDTAAILAAASKFVSGRAKE